MNKATKFCELEIYLKSDVRIHGTFHVDIGTSSTIRPSDAIRQHEHAFLVLSDATIHDGEGSHSRDTIMIRLDAISYIELPDHGWRTGAPGTPETCGALSR